MGVRLTGSHHYQYIELLKIQEKNGRWQKIADLQAHIAVRYELVDLLFLEIVKMCSEFEIYVLLEYKFSTYRRHLKSKKT